MVLLKNLCFSPSTTWHARRYFIAFVFIGAFYMMRLFVGIIVSHFRQFSGTALHTDAQVQWLVMKRYITTQKPEVAPPPRYKCLPSWCGTAGRETAQRIVSHAWFEPGVTLVILLHLCFLATQSVGQAQSWTDTLELVHWVFASVYAAEQLLRMYGGGVIGYIVRDMPWSLYDLVVTAVMIIAPLAGMRTGTGIFRALRFGRVVNLLTRMKGLSRLLETLQNSLGAMANITALLCLVIFVYAVLGMQFFSTTKFGGSLNITSKYVPRWVLFHKPLTLTCTAGDSFETFFQAVLTLFQIVCGEVWLTLMHDASVGLPFCTEAYGDVASDCGAPLLGPLFFFSFFILTFAVFLNLYVAAILDTYSSSQSSSEGVPWMMTLSDYNSFREVWRKFDPAGTKGIPASKLDDLMVALAEAGHPLSQTEGSALTRRVRMAFARTMIAEISGAGSKQLDTSARRLKFVPVLLVRSCSVCWHRLSCVVCTVAEPLLTGCRCCDHRAWQCPRCRQTHLILRTRCSWTSNARTSRPPPSRPSSRRAGLCFGSGRGTGTASAGLLLSHCRKRTAQTMGRKLRPVRRRRDRDG